MNVEQLRRVKFADGCSDAVTFGDSRLRGECANGIAAEEAMVASDGPYLLMAVLCQTAQQDQYGSFSVVNVLEQLVAGTSDPNAPEQMPTFRFQGDLAISIASGKSSGSHTVSVVPIQPDGERLDPVTQRIKLKGNDHRATVVSNVSIDITQEGVYWFNVTLDDRPLTRIPLRIRYERDYVEPWSKYVLEH